MFGSLDRPFARNDPARYYSNCSVRLDTEGTVVLRACTAAWWRGTHENRGLLPLNTSVRLLKYLALCGSDTRKVNECKGGIVDIVYYRCAGLDISKRDVKVCVRTQEPGRARATSTVTTWAAVTSQVLAPRDHLIAGSDAGRDGDDQ